MTVAQRRSRRILAAAFAGALVPAAIATGASAEEPDTEIQTLIEQKVDPRIIEEIDDKGDAELWLLFAGTPDYDAAFAADAKEDKGTAAVEAAKAFAADSQADVAAALDEAGADYESFWGASAIKVEGGDDLVADLVAFDEVEAILPAPEVERVEPITPGDKGGDEFQTWDAVQTAAVEWGVEEVGAPDVWDQGFTGEGIVVASIDSGVQYDHPALVEQYRGNNGDGTFTHDYNFYDVADACENDEPCDFDGHGTHTMGTMVGADGIGVAPGAEWIAVNGCCPDEETLLRAGEWIAAPTDAEGRGADPLKAPHVVNNSWGGYGYDPFYAQVVDLWHAAGIIPVFAAGNGGDACLTMGSPGIYENVIAVGAYGEDGLIADFSSRGHGWEGVVKPDLTAPGVDVYSALPDDEYGLGSGTSMAAPHVVGSIALLLSASPTLEGDYDAVYETLTGTARPVADDQCGGDKELNNVYGHGKLDAEDAVDEAPEGKFGSLSGQVRDDAGEPVAGARLVFEGGVVRETTTGADGAYAFDRIPAGRYHVTVSKFLYETVHGSVRVKNDGEAVFDAELPKLETRVVEGAVVDGGGHGWALDATVSTAGGEAAAATDPFTGAFSLEIPADGDWPLTVETDYDGYETVVVDPADAALIAVPPLPGCLAAGYGSDVLDERFESLALPEGWEVVDRGEATGWVFDDPAGYGNLTPGSGGYAEANSDAADPEQRVDSDLITPAFDLSAAEDTTASFASFFIDDGIGAEAEVSVSADGGATWEQVWYTNEDLEATVEVVDLSAWADETAVQLKFTFDDNDTWAYFWMLDNVRIGCGELEGGLVRGTVTDAGTGEPIAGAVVTDPATGNAAVTEADGEYVLFTSAGAAVLEAAADGWTTATAEADVEADAVVGADFELEAAA